ncbi:hypothetical protein KJ849_00520 [bacterium]|nr:hypothetical protein [bacterium]
MNSILFVCTGNTCRSVIAEYTIKKWIAKFKDDLHWKYLS